MAEGKVLSLEEFIIAVNRYAANGRKPEKLIELLDDIQHTSDPSLQNSKQCALIEPGSF